MSATTRLAAMTATGLFVLTACGDDEPDQPTGTETQGGEETGDNGSYDSAADLGVEDAQAFLSNYVVNLSGVAPRSYAGPENQAGNEGFSTISADCEQSGEGFECEVIGGSGSATAVLQEVSLEFHDIEDSNDVVEARIIPGTIVEVYDIGYEGGDGDAAWLNGVFSPDVSDAEEHYSIEVPLSAFESPDPETPRDRPEVTG